MSKALTFKYNHLIHFENKKNSMYHQLINWISGEFDLNLKDDSKGLKVFIPNGLIYVKEKSDKANITIEVKSNSLKKSEELTNRVNSLFSRLEKLYS